MKIGDRNSMYSFQERSPEMKLQNFNSGETQISFLRTVEDCSIVED